MSRFKTYLKGGLYLVLSFLICAYLYVPVAGAYHDVEEQHWARKEIELLTSQGIIGGYPGGDFKPNRQITRAEMTKVVIDALNFEPETWTLEVSPAIFRDVSPSNWAKEYIQVAYEMGLVNGYKDGTFRPGQFIRRDELVTILMRALKYSGGDVEALPFKDAGEIPAWARESVAVAVERGIVGGYPDDTFRPHNFTTRAEAAVLITGFLDERGNCYDFYGTLQDLDVANKKATIKINGREAIFSYAGSSLVYRGDKLALWNELLGAIPTPVFFNLNSSGEINFLEALGRAPEQSVDLKVTSQEPLEGKNNFSSAFEEARLEPLMPAVGNTLERPGGSLEITKEEISASGMTAMTGADGKGTVIAVIDTGVDAAHPDLQLTSDGKAKIIDWVDFTGEGKVNTPGTLQAGAGSCTIGAHTYQLGNISSRNGVLRYGFLEESILGHDVDGDQVLESRFLIIAADLNQPEGYDTVYIDTDGDRDLREETPLTIFRNGYRSVELFSGQFPGKGFSLVLSGIDPAGEYVTLGFDANGHGTHVAGVAAACGTVRGVAPGARLMVIKAVSTKGETDWEMLAKAVEYASSQGADIVNLSIGNKKDLTAGNNSLTSVINRLSEEKGIVFTIAAGNQGPGINSTATPGNAREAISIGAYISPQMWLEDYGWHVPRETLWYFSSVGPRLDGFLAPQVVAPGSAVSTYPSWSGSRYALMEGTSVAAPHVAGAVALLLESAREKGLKAGPQEIKKALELGARPFDHLNPLEEGYGAVNVKDAWKELQKLPEFLPVKGFIYNRSLGVGEGLLARDFVPALLSFRIRNSGNSTLRIFWETTADWMHPQMQETLLPGNMERRVPLLYRPPDEPGLYVGFLSGKTLFGGEKLHLISALVVPKELNAENQYRVEIAGRAEAGQYCRHFFKVPEGTGKLNFTLEVPKDEEGYRGRVRLHLIDPLGNDVDITDYAGLGPDGVIVRGTVASGLEKPRPGVWEAVVYSSASLSSYGRQESRYILTAQGRDVIEETPVEIPGKRWLLGIVPKKLVPGKLTYLTLQVRDRLTKQPVNGTILINNRLYEIFNGEVTFPVIPESQTITIQVGS